MDASSAAPVAADEVPKKKACVNCTQAKAKCTPYRGQPDLCERCQRLGKSCVYLQVARRKGPRRTRSRVQQLERKMETLMSMLSNERQQPTPSNSGASATTRTPEDNFSRTANKSHPSVGHIPIIEDGSDYSDSEYADIIDRGIVHASAAVSLIELYRRSFSHYCPFIVIPKDFDLATFRKERPFLFLTIISMTSIHDRPLQQMLGDEIYDQIASRVVIRSEKSLDILQGLIIFSFWNHAFYRAAKRQLGLLVQLCVAQVYDLGLSKNPQDRIYRRKANGMVVPNSDFESDRTWDEKRALIGTFYLTSLYARVWRKRSTMLCSKLMDQHALSLMEANLTPTDLMIRPLVALQELSIRVNDFFSYDDPFNCEIHGSSVVEMAVVGFTRELDSIRANAASSTHENILFKLEVLSISIWINEAAIHNKLWPPSEFSAIRISMLNRCIKSATASLSTVLGVPNELFFHFSVSIWCTWFHAMMAACKVVFVQDDSKENQTTNAMTPDVIHQGGGPWITPQSVSSPPPNNPAGNWENVRTGAQLWDPLTVSKEHKVAARFQDMLDKISSMVSGPSRLGQIDTLQPILTVQSAILTGFVNRLRRLEANETHTIDGAQLQGPSSTLPPGQQPLPPINIWGMQGQSVGGSQISPEFNEFPGSAAIGFFSDPYTTSSFYNNMISDMAIEEYAIPEM